MMQVIVFAAPSEGRSNWPAFWDNCAAFALVGAQIEDIPRGVQTLGRLMFCLGSPRRVAALASGGKGAMRCRG